MKLPTRLRYGARALCALARLQRGRSGRARPVPVRVLARDQRLSVKYLEAIVGRLRRARLVRTTEGAHGGCILARRPEAIRMGAVFRALEGPLALVPCVRRAACCPRSRGCPTRRLWAAVGKAVERTLDGTTVRDLMERRGGRQKDEG